MEKNTPSFHKESPSSSSNKKNIHVKAVDLEKEQINTDLSNDLSPTLVHVSNLMSPHIMINQGSLNFIQSDISTMHENSQKKISEESLYFKKPSPSNFVKNTFSVEFPSYISHNLIKAFFIDVINERNYEIIEQGNNYCLAIYKEKFSLKDVLSKCLPWKYEENSIAAIRLFISTDKINNKKLIVFKVLQEKNNRAYETLDVLKNKIEDFEQKIKNIDFNINPDKIEQHFSGLLALVSDLKETSDPFEEMTSRIILPSTLESYSYYYFQKILTSEAYNIGKRISDFINDFLHNYRSMKESAELLPQPMESILSLINETINVLFSDFNYGKNETKQLMPFARKSVEKYIFSKLYQTIISMYREKNQQDDENFANKLKSIQNKHFLTLFKSLEIQKKFWLIEEEYFDQEQKLVFCDKDNFIKPYESAINEANKLNDVQSPCEKLAILLMANSMMKTCVVDFHKGKLELNTMDDELPLTIYVLSQTKIQNLMAELNFVDDYIRFFQEYESEVRLITNLRVSFQYILNEWNI